MSRMERVLSLLMLALSCTQVFSYPVNDEVVKLPGWQGNLLSRVFSGFVPAGSEVQGNTTYDYNYWYLFIEAEGVKDPTTAPIILWTNGGPGASSAYGLFCEIGPYQLSDQSLLTDDYKATGVPTLFANQYSWSKFANLLILNGGGPVGFTYCLPAGPSAGGDRCGSWSDDNTAVHNQAFVANWFATAFPEYRSSSLYLVGESYAGVYISMLADAILSSPTTSSLNVVGVALGDACMGTDILCGPPTGPWFSLLFKGGHGCLSMATFTSILDQCDHAALKSPDYQSHISPQCKALLKVADQECPNNSYYGYNYYDKCGQAAFLSSSMVGSPAEPNGFPCGGDTALTEWMNREEVKQSLNVPVDAVYFSADNGAGYTYDSTYRNAIPTLRRLALDNRHRVLIYNGDSDPGLSSLRAQNWTTTALELEIVEPFRPFTVDTQQQLVGGAVITFQGQFQFVQIKGSGHMVPMYAPQQAYVMMKSWVQNTTLPRFVAAN